jgi:EmrB/QacA subfamily drug resistance transporter
MPAVAVRKTPLLAIVLASYLMIVLDISITITAIPRIRSELSFSAANLSWVQTAYTLAFGGLLLLGARAGDILGRRRMFVTGIALFTVASLLVGAAQSSGWLIAARALQGVGAAILAPSTLSMLQTSFEEGSERTRAVAYYGAVAGIGASLGLVLGGVVTDAISWRVGFFVNVPIGIAMALAAPRLLPETERRPGQLDIAGAIGSTLGMTALVYGLVRAAEDGWGDAVTLVALAVGVVLLTGLVIHERRASQPIMPLRLFASAERSAAYAGRILFLGAMMGFWFFITQYLQAVKGYSPLEAGLGFLPMTAVNFAVALAVPKLTRRYGNGLLLAGGLAVTMLGMLWLSRLSGDTGYLTGVALPMILIGGGQGATLSPLTAAAIAGVAPEDAGAASGLVNVAHQLGGSLGLGILVTVFAAADAGGLGADALLAHRVSTSLTVGTGMLGLALVLVVALIVRPRTRRHRGAPTRTTSCSVVMTARERRQHAVEEQHARDRRGEPQQRPRDLRAPVADACQRATDEDDGEQLVERREHVDGADGLRLPRLRPDRQADRPRDRPDEREAAVADGARDEQPPAQRTGVDPGRPHRLQHGRDREAHAEQPVLLEVHGDHDGMDEARGEHEHRRQQGELLRRRRRGRALPASRGEVAVGVLPAAGEAGEAGEAGAHPSRRPRLLDRAQPRANADEVGGGGVLAEAVEAEDQRQRHPEAAVATRGLPLRVRPAQLVGGQRDRDDV